MALDTVDINDTTAIDKKQNAQLKIVTRENVASKYAMYFANVIMIIAIFIFYIGSSGLSLYLCKLAQSNILPTCTPNEVESFDKPGTQQPAKSGDSQPNKVAELNQPQSGGGDSQTNTVAKPKQPVTITNIFNEPMNLIFPHAELISTDPTWEELTKVNQDINDFVVNPIKPPDITKQTQESKKVIYNKAINLYNEQVNSYNTTLTKMKDYYKDWDKVKKTSLDTMIKTIKTIKANDSTKLPNVTTLNVNSILDIKLDASNNLTLSNDQITAITQLKEFVLALKNVETFETWKTNNAVFKDANSTHVFSDFINKHQISTENFIFEYILVIIQWLLWLPNFIINHVMNYMNENLNEHVIVLFGPFILGILLFALMGIIPFYYIGVCLYNFPLAFQEKIPGEKDGYWQYITSEYGFFNLLGLIVIRFFTWWILIPVAFGLSFASIPCFIISIVSIFLYKCELNIESSGPLSISLKVIKKYIIPIVALSSIYVCITAFTDLGIIAGVISFVIFGMCLYILYKYHDLIELIKTFFKSLKPDKSKSTEQSKLTVRTCTPKPVFDTAGGFWGTLKKEFMNKLTLENIMKEAANQNKNKGTQAVPAQAVQTATGQTTLATPATPATPATQATPATTPATTTSTTTIRGKPNLTK